MDNITDKEVLIETLLQQRDELYQELSRLRQIDNGALAKAEEKITGYEDIIKKKDIEINKRDLEINKKDLEIKKLIDQLEIGRAHV